MQIQFTHVSSSNMRKKSVLCVVIKVRNSSCTHLTDTSCIPPTSSRRAVSEHQLMHDRSRNIQSLKRLIWLSSAIEGLHTAETRSAPLDPAKGLNLALNPALVSSAAAGSPQPGRVHSLLRDFFIPNLIQLPDREPEY